MIGTGNYFYEIRKIDIQKLPEALQKGHELVVKSTDNGDNWKSYENSDTIRKVIDLYFEKLNKFLASSTTKTTEVEIQPKSEPRPNAIKARRELKPGKAQKSSPSSKSKGNPKPRRGKNVERIREEVRFVKRYVGLHNKVKSPSAILSFIKGLQRAIVQKLIRKTSPFAKEIQMIQDKLVSLYNSMNGDRKIELNDKDLKRLVTIAGGEQVYPSINIIRRYIGIQGRELEHEKIESFQKLIETALKKEKVGADDPYRDKVQAIQNSLKKLKAGGVVQIGRAELNGLEGIIKACGCLPKRSNTRKLKERNRQAYKRSSSRELSGVLTAEEMASRTFEMLDLKADYASLIGRPAKNFSMMLHGEPNAGKTTFLLKFAKYLAENFGKVIYISSEEFSASTMTAKVNEILNPFPPNLFFYYKLTDLDLSEYDFIVLDSINDLGLRIQDFKALRKEHPHAAFIIILQHTKDGSYRGGKDWEHEVEIAGEVVNGTVTIYRNRYGVKGTINFFNDASGSNTYSTLKPY